MKKRLCLCLILLFSVVTATICYAEETSTLSRVTVDLTDELPKKDERDASFGHFDKKYSYLPKTGEKKTRLLPLLSLMFCLFTIVFKLKKNVSFKIKK
ncbi:hypothetical protein A5881_002386 [Enterococcus termitis]|nr:hypothetical protein A5881_001295 [Enterococcus termitis]